MLLTTDAAFTVLLICACVLLFSGQEVSELPPSSWEIEAGLLSTTQPFLVPPRQMQPLEDAPNSAQAAANANGVPLFVPRAAKQAQLQLAQSHFEVTAAKVVWALQKYFKVCLALDPQAPHRSVPESYIDVMLQTPAFKKASCRQVQMME